MSFQDDLIKLGTTNPDLRPHIRPLLICIWTKGLQCHKIRSK